MRAILNVHAGRRFPAIVLNAHSSSLSSANQFAI